MAMAMPPADRKCSDLATAALCFASISGVGSWYGAPGPLTAAIMMERVPTHKQTSESFSFFISLSSPWFPWCTIPTLSRQPERNQPPAHRPAATNQTCAEDIRPGTESRWDSRSLSLVSPRMRQRETARLKCSMRAVRRDAIWSAVRSLRSTAFGGPGSMRDNVCLTAASEKRRSANSAPHSKLGLSMGRPSR